MHRAASHLAVGTLALGLLLAIPEIDRLSPARPGAAVDRARDGQELAQRRKRTKPKPKPAPKPEPAPEEPVADPAAAPEGGGGGAGAALPVGPGGTTRVEFEGIQVKGQTTKAGEVQILERKDSALKSMVKRRTSYREEIIQTVFPEQAGSL